jgi:TRAP-type C4-dicarboxylate transport system permease small subunit
MRLIASVLRLAVFLLLVALVASVGTGVFYRYVLGRSLYWATEVPNLLFVWTVFLGAAAAYHERKHIAFTLLAERLPYRARRALSVLAALVVLGFMGFLLQSGIELVERTMASRSEALKIPQGYLYLCLPLVAAVMALDTLAELWRLLRGDGGARPPP